MAAHAGELRDPEAFLTAFMRTQAWRDDAEAPMTGWGRARASDPDDEAGSDAESELEAIDAADEFEAKYNFRFEDPEGAMVGFVE